MLALSSSQFDPMQTYASSADVGCSV